MSYTSNLAHECETDGSFRQDSSASQCDPIDIFHNTCEAYVPLVMDVCFTPPERLHRSDAFVLLQPASHAGACDFGVLPFSFPPSPVFLYKRGDEIQTNLWFLRRHSVNTLTSRPNSKESVTASADFCTPCSIIEPSILSRLGVNEG